MQNLVTNGLICAHDEEGLKCHKHGLFLYLKHQTVVRMNVGDVGNQSKELANELFKVDDISACSMLLYNVAEKCLNICQLV